MEFHKWAHRWKIPAAAIRELEQLYFEESVPAISPGRSGVSEGDISNRIRLQSAKDNCYLWRNNVGVLPNEYGRPVRFGLANDNPQVNKVIKSSDLIGIKPRVVEESMLGLTIGQFMCREVKREGWIYKATPREKAQLNWINLIQSLGGDAGFTSGEGDA